MENFIFCEVLTTINLHQSLPSILTKALIRISKLKQDQTCTICHWTTWNSLQIIHKKFFIIFWTFLHFNIPWCSWTTVVCYSDACLKWLHIANIIWIVSSQPYWSSSSWKIRKFFALLFWDNHPLPIWSSFCSVFFCVRTYGTKTNTYGNQGTINEVYCWGLLTKMWRNPQETEDMFTAWKCPY